MLCIVEGCTRDMFIKKVGMCQGHYGQQWRGVPLTALPHKESAKACSIKGCTNKALSKGLCTTCYGRKRTFKLSDRELESVLSGECEICRSTERLTVDHDHSCCPDKSLGVTCGKCVRGILCNNCNTILGVAKDDIESLEAMIAYLRSYPRLGELPLHGPHAKKKFLRPATCTYATCDLKAMSKGLCNTHYHQQLRGEELSDFTPRKQKS